ncbi:MAG: peptidase S45 [Gemmataceae bacterium]|nr:MAG: peptidase S45 [Gemmataceae bacterium]
MNLYRFLLRLFLGRRLPRWEGELRLSGPRAPITIRRDCWGIPHIDAACDTDALFALGFCQGQDRAGQLEILWRLSRGRLAEWVGIAALGLDRLSRRIGFRRAALAQLEVQFDWVREWLAAFTAGVNAGLSAGLPRKPHEFAILGGQPSPWDEADLLAVLKLQSFLLPSNWDMELLRFRILLQDGPDAVVALDPSATAEPAPHAGATGIEAGLNQLRSEIASLRAYLGLGGGSNNWVIAGQRTARGKPLLANDPHLSPTVPPPWYLAHVRTPEWEATGAMLAGSLGFGIGHNGFCAWGVTAALSDNTDLFVEILHPDGSSVREPDGGWKPCERVQEVIHVRRGADYVEEVLITPRGPIVTPALADVPYALSLRAVWLEPLPIDGFLSAPRARSFAQFRQAFAHWPLLPLNVVYADSAGTIGWQMIGQIPRRKSGTGLLPAGAAQPDGGWDKELIPFEQMPYVENPPQGYWVTANQNPRLDLPDLEIHLGWDYCDPYRYRAIREALANQPQGWTVEECLKLQTTTRSLPWEEIRDIVLSLSVQDRDAAEALELLKNWNGEVSADSPAAAVFEVFVTSMIVELTKLRAPHTWQLALQSGDSNLFADRRVGHLIHLLRNQPAGWVSSWPQFMEQALGQAVRRLRQHAGPGHAYWSWGHLRMLRLKHLVFGTVRGLSACFNVGPVPCPGDANTISQAAVSLLNPFADTHNMANLRAVFDLAQLGESRFILCGGQSGNPCSPHYDDQLPLWQRGEAITLSWSQTDVIRATRHTLRLLPALAPADGPSSPVSTG